MTKKLSTGMSTDDVDRPDSSVGRASAFRAGGPRFESRWHHTKGVKNDTSSSIADTGIKELC